jgi:predicted RNA methylase
MEQQHLDHSDTVNLGSYYTPSRLVDLVYALIAKNVVHASDYVMLDTSCGYGGFLRGVKTIGADIDTKAIQTARENAPCGVYFHHNSLFQIARAQYRLNNHEKIIIVGNPPYNDTTSMIRNDIKKTDFPRDAAVMSRDLGISFLRSYDKLAADFVCVLHPLSYLIKKANFESLGQFKNNYKLIDSVVVSSGVFPATSKTTSFPIIIALYERNLSGMDYAYIQDYQFKTSDDTVFSLQAFDTIGNYIPKYPNHTSVRVQDAAAYFYTMRDINALKRAATFLEKETSGAVRVTKPNLPYYCYVDVFKEYIPHIPYYFGNSDIMIHHDSFQELKRLFVSRSVQKHPQLGSYLAAKKYNDEAAKISGYFRQLLGAHYVD